MNQPICKDCAYFHSNRSYPDYSRCSAPQSVRQDPVTGVVSKGFCSINRDYSHRCGPRGDWFVAHPPQAPKVRWRDRLRQFFSLSEV